MCGCVCVDKNYVSVVPWWGLMVLGPRGCACVSVCVRVCACVCVDGRMRAAPFWTQTVYVCVVCVRVYVEETSEWNPLVGPWST